MGTGFGSLLVTSFLSSRGENLRLCSKARREFLQVFGFLFLLEGPFRQLYRKVRENLVCFFLKPQSIRSEASAQPVEARRTF